MSITVLGVGTTALKVTIGGTDITDHVKTVTITQDVDPVEITAMNAVAKTYAPGLRDDSMEFEFYQDFASSKVYALINPIIGSVTGSTVIVQSNGATVSATDPKWTMVGSPYSFTPLDGSVGDASMTKVKFQPVAGSYITAGTS